MNFKIGTFNLYNLVLPEHIFYEDKKYSKEEYEKKINWTAKQLDLMEVDIVGFQEVFHQKALDEVLMKTSLLKNSSFIVACEVGNLPRLGLASKFPITKHEFITNFPPESIIEKDVLVKEFQRPVIKATITLPNNKNVTVFVIHLKSRRPILDNPEQRYSQKAQTRGKAKSMMIRTAEANALRFILLNELEKTKIPVIVMGDFNDPGRGIVELITGTHPSRKTSHENKKNIWDSLLYNAYDVNKKPSEIYYTHISDGYYETIDNILLSEEFIHQNPERIGEVEHVKVFNDHLMDKSLTYEMFPMWQSDHGQVVATIRLLI